MYVEKKGTVTVKENMSGNMGTEEMEMSFREELWERKKRKINSSSLLSLVLLFFPFSTKNVFF